MRKDKVFNCIALSIVLLAGSLHAESEVGIKIDLTATGKPIPQDFSGLSFETSNISPGGDGRYLFDPQNKALVRMFKTLGIRSLRLGGSMADRPGVAIPGPADIDHLFAFASAADVRVIYTLRLRNGDAADDTAIAKYIDQHDRPLLTCFAIGNEPNFYIHDYADYLKQWKKFESAVRTAVPEAKFCGPSALDKNDWAANFVHDFAGSNSIAFITQHAYFGGSNRKIAAEPAADSAPDAVPDAAAWARDQMLSPAWLDRYGEFFNSFAAAALASGLRYRLEETNNFSDGGVDGASNTFAAALWALDYLHWWAAHGAAGINFHNRRWILNCVIYPAAGQEKDTPEQFSVRPIAYGIKAFDLGGRGAMLPIDVSDPDKINLTAYAVRDAGHLLLTIINKEHATAGHQPVAATVTIASRGLGDRAESISLAATHANPAAESDVTLGGREIARDGSWNEKWETLKREKSADYRITVPPTSAVVLRIPLQGKRNSMN